MGEVEATYGKWNLVGQEVSEEVGEWEFGFAIKTRWIRGIDKAGIRET